MALYSSNGSERRSAAAAECVIPTLPESDTQIYGSKYRQKYLVNMQNQANGFQTVGNSLGVSTCGGGSVQIMSRPFAEPKKLDAKQDLMDNDFSVLNGHLQNGKYPSAMHLKQQPYGSRNVSSSSTAAETSLYSPWSHKTFRPQYQFSPSLNSQVDGRLDFSHSDPTVVSSSYHVDSFPSSNVNCGGTEKTVFDELVSKIVDEDHMVVNGFYDHLDPLSSCSITDGFSTFDGSSNIQLDDIMSQGIYGAANNGICNNSFGDSNPLLYNKLTSVDHTQSADIPFGTDAFTDSFFNHEKTDYTQNRNRVYHEAMFGDRLDEFGKHITEAMNNMSISGNSASYPVNRSMQQQQQQQQIPQTSSQFLQVLPNSTHQLKDSSGFSSCRQFEHDYLNDDSRNETTISPVFQTPKTTSNSSFPNMISRGVRHSLSSGLLVDVPDTTNQNGNLMPAVNNFNSSQQPFSQSSAPSHSSYHNFPRNLSSKYQKIIAARNNIDGSHQTSNSAHLSRSSVMNSVCKQGSSACVPGHQLQRPMFISNKNTSNSGDMTRQTLDNYERSSGGNNDFHNESALFPHHLGDYIESATLPPVRGLLQHLPPEMMSHDLYGFPGTVSHHLHSSALKFPPSQFQSASLADAAYEMYHPFDPYLHGRGPAPLYGNGDMFLDQLPHPALFAMPPPIFGPRFIRRSGPSNDLHIRLEECYEQFRNLEKERKKTEAELARQNPGKKVSSTNNIPIPRLPPNPSRVDRLIVDELREHAKVITLVAKMEQLRGVEVHQNIHKTMEKWLEAIRNVQARRRDEIINATNRHRSGASRAQEEKDVVALSNSIQELIRATRKARTSMWCALNLTILFHLDPALASAQNCCDLPEETLNGCATSPDSTESTSTPEKKNIAGKGPFNLFNDATAKKAEETAKGATEAV